MLPVTLFDKSFLQSLSVDESVWFDTYFYANVCPMFYVETLADLGKQKGASGRSPEDEVSNIAEKFPDMHGTPSVHHHRLCVGNLLGHAISMDNKIPLAGGRPVRVNGESGFVFDSAPETTAFQRWSRGQFLDIEREFASDWRQALSSLDLSATSELFRELGIDGKSCRSLEEARDLAKTIVNGQDKAIHRMKMAIVFLGVPNHLHARIFERWKIAGYPSLPRYAPYAAYVLTVELFFQLAIAASLISSARPSNRMDIAYLYYLPFCEIFVSNDNQQERWARVFLGADQTFVSGPELKGALKAIAAWYASLPIEEQEKGIMGRPSGPPKSLHTLIHELWDKHRPGWKELIEPKLPLDPEANDLLVKRLGRITEAPTLAPDQVDFDPGNSDTLSLTRFVAKRKGSVWLLPKDLKRK